MLTKIIIEVRVNEYAMRDENPHVPWSAAEIARDAAECREAGAAIVHWHARDGATGGPAQTIENVADAILKIREASDILVKPPLEFLGPLGPKERYDDMLELARDPRTRPDFSPVDTASVNLAMYQPDTRSFTSPDLVYQNPTGVMAQVVAALAASGVKSQHTCWGISSLRTLDAFMEMGIIKGPAFANLFLSGQGWLSAHPATVKGLYAYLDFLPTSGPVEWLTGCSPGSMLPLAGAAIEAGGHIGVGLGDHHYREWGRPTNAEVVRRFADMARAMGREAATPAETRGILGMEN